MARARVGSLSRHELVCERDACSFQARTAVDRNVKLHREPGGARRMVAPLGFAGWKIATTRIELLQMALDRRRLRLCGVLLVLVVPTFRFNVAQEPVHGFRRRFPSLDETESLRLRARLRLLRFLAARVGELALDRWQTSGQRGPLSIPLHSLQRDLVRLMDNHVTIDQRTERFHHLGVLLQLLTPVRSWRCWSNAD